ncbi:DNRLRE domain-containing protein [Candidatus Thorarchaeota archaeon]|nr:MAG: DNRLRE domain-containing protein [Candidatus Thorarchaeota archaeon]
MKNRLLALMLVLMFSVTTLSVLPVTMNATTLAARPALEVRNTLADGETYSMKIPVLEDESVTQNHPTTNYDGSEFQGGLWVGRDAGGSMFSRSWIKFDLAHVPCEIAITRAVYKAYLNVEYNVTGGDEPIGVYYSEDDSWADDTITWNTQPVFSVDPEDVIDSPADPDMFVPDEWYEWDVTSSVISALNEDKVLSLVMKEVAETGTRQTWKYFIERESVLNPPTHLEIEYVVPGINTLAVDGHTSSPLIDYIQSDAPDFSWNPVLQSGDFQSDFQLEVWNNSIYNDTMFMQEKHSTVGTFFSGAALANSRPFGTDDEMRFQFKYTQPLVPKTGLIDKLFFEMSEESGTIVLENLSIFLLGVDSVTDLTSSFEGNYEGREPIQVLYRESYTATTKNNWLELDIENTYILSMSTSLIVEVRFTNNTGDLLHAMQTTGQGGSVAYEYGTGAQTATTATYLYTRTHGLRVELVTDTILEAGGTKNWLPFGADDGYQGRFQLKYNQSLINHEGIIDKLYFTTGVFATETTYENLSVYLLETPVDGFLNGTVLNENYGGLTPTLVLSADTYTVQNLGYTLVIDVNNIFYYTNSDDLLIELRWDSKEAPGISTDRLSGQGGYRAYDLRYASVDYLEGDNLANALYVDFIYDTTSFQYCSCFPLVNGTEYYLRVRISDSTGVWSNWATKTFKYEVLTSAPEWEGPINDPNPGVVGTPVTVSINVTYFLGVDSVLFEMAGTNHSMTGAGDTYEYTWTPSTAANVTYTIYMESAIGTWSSVLGDLSIIQGGISVDPMLLAIIGVAALIIIIVIVIVMKRKK